MTYDEALKWLYEAAPAYHNNGPGAYKPGLANVKALAEAFGNPHRCLQCVHVAGTNGKGSVSSLIAAAMTASGRKTALYTSPHLLDFRERIRIDGEMIPREEVVAFVKRYQAMELDIAPSFFELTTIMAFQWFAANDVDVAVIETGLGGRLDSTNIINPMISVITNVALDHMALLGDTEVAIAAEKSGIVKGGIPVVVGECSNAGVKRVLEGKASLERAPIFFADAIGFATPVQRDADGMMHYRTRSFGEVRTPLDGDWQLHNVNTAVAVLDVLEENSTMPIDHHAVKVGFENVLRLTGLMGRWTKVADVPLTICDTGHNPAAWQYIVRRLIAMPRRRIHVVMGFVADKDVRSILEILEPQFRYYFTNASVHRALPADELRDMAREAGLSGEAYPSLAEALEEARRQATADDMIFVGGSNFLVADLLKYLEK